MPGMGKWFAGGLLSSALVGLVWVPPWWAVFPVAGLAVVLAVARWVTRPHPGLLAKMAVMVAVCRLARWAWQDRLDPGFRVELDVMEEVGLAVLAAPPGGQYEVLAAGRDVLDLISGDAGLPGA